MTVTTEQVKDGLLGLASLLQTLGREKIAATLTAVANRPLVLLAITRALNHLLPDVAAIDALSAEDRALYETAIVELPSISRAMAHVEAIAAACPA